MKCKYCGNDIEEKLKPCPFCGGDAIVIDHSERLEAEIKCRRCGCSIYRCKEKNKKKNFLNQCIKAWNRRIK